MKKILSIFVLFLSFSFASANEFNFIPLWGQDKHFQQYQCLIIEASIARIESVLEKAEANDIDPFLKSMLIDEIAVIKLNLGLN